MVDDVDLSAERDRRTGPDPELRMRDDFGRDMFAFLVSYDIGDAQWNLQIWGYSMEDAQARVDAMKVSVRLDGQIFTTVVP